MGTSSTRIETLHRHIGRVRLQRHLKKGLALGSRTGMLEGHFVTSVGFTVMQGTKVHNLVSCELSELKQV
jgi:hypothetical protein